MIGALLYVFGSYESHSKLTEEMHIPLRPLSKEGCLRQQKTLFVVDVSIIWATGIKWQTKVLDTWKVTHLNLLRQERVKSRFKPSVGAFASLTDFLPFRPIHLYFFILISSGSALCWQSDSD